MEDHKTLYEQRLERAKEEIKKCGDNKGRIRMIENIFPELRESEDERIRKGIIRNLEFLMDRAEGFVKEELQQRIAWLEKQDPKKHEEELERAYKCADEVQYRKGYEDAKREFEKQGEHKESLCDKCKREQPSHSCQDITELGRCAVEHEQKTADKVEPKFHAGDFITDGERIFHIKETVWERNNRNDGSTYCESLIVNLRDGNTYADDRDLKEYHLWTIQDAKDGDVIYHKSPSGVEYIVMSSGVNGFGNVDSYFRYNSVDGFGIDIPSVLSAKVDDITPATKEQCDFLFQKMKEAGYEWDSEKKELKKIEQKPTWSEEDEAYCELLLDIMAIEHPKGIFTTTGINYFKGHNVARYQIDFWLKSLKERYSWKPSDEQMKALVHVINLMASSENPTENNYYYNLLKDMRTQLKKLREE